MSKFKKIMLLFFPSYVSVVCERFFVCCGTFFATISRSHPRSKNHAGDKKKRCGALPGVEFVTRVYSVPNQSIELSVWNKFKKIILSVCCSVTFQRVQRTFLDTSFHCRLTQVTLRYRGWRWCTTYSIRRLLVEDDLSSSRIVFYF